LIAPSDYTPIGEEIIFMPGANPLPAIAVVCSTRSPGLPVCGYNSNVNRVTRFLGVFLVVFIGGLLAFSASVDARVMPAPYFPYFYNPFPASYQKNLVKIFDGITPGTTTLQEILERYGYPKYVVNNRYFYYERLTGVDRASRGSRENSRIYIEFRKSKKLGMPRYLGGLDLTAVVSRIFVSSDYRMGELATYLDQILSVTVYPYELYYVPVNDLRYGSQEEPYPQHSYRDDYSDSSLIGDYYALIFPYQGYAMYFDGLSERFFGEAYFEPKLYQVRESVRFYTGNFDFRKIELDNLPPYLR